MKIAVYLPGSRPTDGGGATFQSTVVRALKKHGLGNHELVFVYEQHGPGGGLVAPFGGLTITKERVVQLSQRVARLLGRDAGRLQLPLDRLLDAHDVELVWFVATAFRATDMPYIQTVWDLQHRQQPWFPEVSAIQEWPLRERAYSDSIERATAVIVANSVAADELKRLYNATDDRIICAPHPAPAVSPLPAEEAAAERRSLGLGDESYVFYPAQFWPHKNHTTLLRAVALNNATRTPLRLVLTGSDKGNRAHIQAQAAELGLTDTLFPGFVSDRALVALYQGAHALGFPSFFGPENLPPLEAFALECPVIAVDVPGMREQLGDAPLWVAPTDAAAMSDALGALHDAKTRRKHIKAGTLRLDGRSAEDYLGTVREFVDHFADVRAAWPPGV
ncbi:MAG: glycosyltransferase involved in cell wall biosynthesis [Bradymonadia bacterium]|jgi:glycosyltransferase involved in cell wall biosynthesis